MASGCILELLIFFIYFAYIKWKLGLHIVEKRVSKIKTRNTDFRNAEKANLGGYERTIYRIWHFPFLHKLLHQPSFIIFNPQLAQSMIDAEFMLYNIFSGRYIHLGIKKEDNSDFYVPVTFLERKPLIKEWLLLKLMT